MNNDAKDLIGQLRTINILIMLLKIDKFVFPLDPIFHVLLMRNRLRFVEMVDVVSNLTRFGISKKELLSCIDDIADDTSETYYTKDFVNSLLSLYNGNAYVEPQPFDDVLSLRIRLSSTLRLYVSRLLQSIMWLRVAFILCYPNHRIIDLHSNWSSYCAYVCDLVSIEVCENSLSLMRSSLQYWRNSEIVINALNRNSDSGMPHKAAFFQCVSEVDNILSCV